MPVVGSAQVLIKPTYGNFQKNVTAQMGDLAAKGGRTAGTRLGGAFKTFAKRGAIAAGAAVAATVTGALVKGFGRLTAIENAEAKLRGLGHSADDVAAIMDNALAAVKGTSFGMGEAATVAASAVAAGIKPGEDLERVLGLVGDAATIAGTDMGDMGDIFNKVATSGKLTMREVNQLSSRGVPILQMVADQYGVTAEEASDMVSAGVVDFETFSNAIEDNVAGAALESGNTTQGAFKNLGASIGRVGANLLTSIFPMFKDAFLGITDFLDPLEDKAKIVGEALGRFIGKAADTIGDFIGQMKSGEGAGGTFATILTGIKDAAIGLSGWIKDQVLPVLSDIGTFIRDIIVPAVSNLVDGFVNGEGAGGAFKSVLSGIVGVAKFVVETLVRFRTIIYAVVAAWTAYKVITGIVSAATKVAIAVQWLWNAALNANPIGIVVLALGALVGGLIYAWKNSETFRNVVMAVWNAIKTAVSAVWNFLRDKVFAPFSDAAKYLQDSFNTAKQKIIVAWNAVRDGLAAGWNWIKDKIFAPFGAAVAYLRDSFNTAKQKIVQAWNAVRDGLAAGWNWIKNKILTPLINFIKHVVDVFRTVKNGIIVAWNAVRDGLAAGWNWIKDKVLNAFKTGINNLRTNIKTAVDKIKSIWDGLKSAFSKVWNWINDNVIKKFKTGLNGLKSAVDTVRGNIKKAWEKVANIFRKPINWVLRTVWDDGIKKAFDNVAKLIGWKKRLASAPQIPAFASGGRHGGGWALVGEEGPELVNFDRPGRVYTAAETRAAVAPGTDVPSAPPKRTRSASTGSVGPAVGGWWDKAKSAASGAWDAATGWVRGSMADAAAFVLAPIRNLIGSTVAQWGGFGGLAGNTAKSALDRLVGWIRGKDDEGSGPDGGAPTGKAGKWRRPTAGRITSGYGARWGGFHGGIDISNGGGLTYAAQAGKVMKTGWNIRSGFTGIGILLDHLNGWQSYYGHNPSMGAVKVRPGQSVSQGQRIGQQGATGNATGPHLHFSTWHNGRLVNPSQTGLFDDGNGWLKPGMAAYHSSKMSKPDAILSSQQWDDIHTMASRGAQFPETVTLIDESGALLAKVRVVADDQIKTRVDEFAGANRRRTGSRVN